MDNEFNTFDAGVAAGGLRNKIQIKILIEYLVDAVEGDLTAEMVIQAITMHSLANFFEVSQAISELIETENLTKDENGVLTITGKGRVNLRELVGDLPATVRETAIKDATALVLRLKNKESNSVEIIKNDNGYTVICSVLHEKEPLLKIELYAADYEMADNIRNRFYDDPAGLYSAVLSILYS